ncbi:MAG: hypothetical protein ACPGRC_07010 [Salibacteraceae bacterium]
MKKWLLLLALTYSVIGFTQNVNYKITSNETPAAPKVSVNTDLIQLEVMQNDAFNTLSFNLALWGHVEILPSFVGAQYSFRRSWINMGSLEEKNFDPNLEIELGGYLVFSNRVVTKKTKIVIDSKTVSKIGADDYTVTKSITIPVQKRKQYHLRGGFYRKSTGNNLEYLEGFNELNNGSDFVNFAQSGFYLGINIRTITSAFIETDNYGKSFNSGGRDVYFDLMVLPSNKWEDTDGNDVTDIVKGLEKKGPLGFRIGYKFFQTDPKSMTNKGLGMCMSFDTGIKPYTGVFVQCGIGLTIIKK